MGNIYEKLAYIQQNSVVKKDNYNDEEKYSYWSLDGILGTIAPMLKEMGLCVTTTYEPVEVNGWHYIKATTTLVDVESQEKVMASGYAREAAVKAGLEDPRSTGAAATYAAKYALTGLLGLSTGDKDADAAPRGVQNTPIQAAPAQAVQAASVPETSANPPAEMTLKKAMSITVIDGKGNIHRLGDYMSEPKGLEHITAWKKYLEKNEPDSECCKACQMVYNEMLMPGMQK